MPKDYVKIAQKYANDVIAGEVLAPELTKLSCVRQTYDLGRQNTEDFPYVFNPVMVDQEGVKYQPGNRICALAEVLKHVKGREWIGKNIVLEPWQCFFFSTIFGWVHRDTGLRRFREVYAEIPRKNAKSVKGAIIGIYMFCYDYEGGSEVYSGATSEKQAWEVFRPARLMIEKCSGLKKKFKIRVNAKDIVTGTDHSRFEPIIGNPGDGASPHCAIVDEYHEHKGPELYNTMETGQGARSQPLLVAITTAGSNLAGPCYQKRSHIIKILNRELVNERVFGLIYGLDSGDDWTNFNNWVKVNPNYGVSVYPDYLKKQFLTAIQQPSRQNSIRCKHLNEWMNVASAYFDILALEKCEKAPPIEEFKGEKCFIALDLASKKDLTAFIIMFKRIIEDKEHYYAYCRFYLPHAALRGEDKACYQGWKKEGYLIVTGGARTDYDTIEEDILAIGKHHDIIEIVFDPYNATHLITRVQNQLNPYDSDESTQFIEMIQSVSNLSDPTKELGALILDGHFHYDQNPILRWCLANTCVGEPDTSDRIKPKKARGQEHLKIDGTISTVMALKRAMVYAPEETGGNDGFFI